MANRKNIPGYMNFIFAANAGIGATMICYPLELLKTRLQVYASGKTGARMTTYQLAKHIINEEGTLALYNGLSASMLRQLTYTGTRMGAFNAAMDYFNKKNGYPPGVFGKALISTCTGIVGGIVGLPADIALTRMSADGNVPPEKRRNYKNAIDAIYRIIKEEGVAVLFRGLNAMIVRATVANTSILVSYAQSKEMFIKYGIMDDNTLCHIICSTISAITATACLLPPDIAKIRLQNMKVIDGKPEYSGMLNVWTFLLRKEGIFSLWKGFTPALIRNAPQTILTFVFIENFKYYYKKFVLKDVRTTYK